MRKITEQAIESFYNRKRFKKSNTEVVLEDDKVILKLFKNPIAIIDDNELFITTANHDTRTTIERLNGLRNIWIRNRKGRLTLNNLDWDGSLINVRELLNINTI